MKNHCELHMAALVAGEPPGIRKAAAVLGRCFDRGGRPPRQVVAVCIVDREGQEEGIGRNADGQLVVIEDGVVIRMLTPERALQEFKEDNFPLAVEAVQLAILTRDEVIFFLYSHADDGRYLVGTLTDQQYAQA